MRVFAISPRSIHDNLYLIRSIRQRLCKEAAKGAVLISLNQSKAFDKVTDMYFAVNLRVVGLGPGFRYWIAALSLFSCSI